MAIQSLTKEQVRAILEQAWAYRKRDWLMFLVAYLHAMRCSEVVTLKADNVRDGFISIQRLKGSNATVQPLLSNDDGLFSEREALIDYARACYRNQFLFPITRQHFGRLFKEYARQAGIPAHLSHPHVLRHSLAMHVIKNAGVEHTRQYLGHKSLSSTGEYLKVTDEQASDEVRKALKF